MEKRAGINLNFIANVYEYSFIDHVKQSSFGPVTGATNWFSSGQALFNSESLDDEGWPNTAAASGNTWGGTFLVPASTDHATYVIEWTGQGEIQFNQGTWTVTGGSGYSQVSNGRWTGTDARIEVTYSGSRQGIQWRVLQSNQSSGGYFRRFKFFRAEDEADLDAGYMYRRPWKQIYVDWNPSFIRFMNWHGGNNSLLMRFEDRPLPTYATYGAGNAVVGLPYGETTGTNQLSVSAVTGTPASEYHGHICQTRVTTGLTRCPGSGGTAGAVIVGIEKGATTRVEVTGHPFINGDRVIFRVSAGMTQIDYRVGTVTEDDTNHFYVDIDSTAFSNFTAGLVTQFASLTLGSWGEYPIVSQDGQTPVGVNGANVFRSGDYKTFYFDKHVACMKDGSGALVYGAWLMRGSISENFVPHRPDVPLEVMLKMIIELNEMASTQGKGPIHMYINVPHMALLSMDDDYAAPSNYAIGMADVLINGANGYSGLKTLPGILLFIEYSNETWNDGGSGFLQGQYVLMRGALRSPSGMLNAREYMHSLRSTIMLRDIEGEFPDHPQIRFVLASQGSSDHAAGSPGGRRIYGDPGYFSDALISPATDTPLSLHDHFAGACYFLTGPTGDTWHSTNAPTLAAEYAAATTDEDREGVCAEYVDAVVGVTSQSETVAYYRDLRIPSLDAIAESEGVTYIMYEGGWDRTVTGGTAEVNTFMKACKRSQAWSDAMYSFYKSFRSLDHSELPAGYIIVDERWGHTAPDTYSGGVEGAGLDAAWERIGRYNKNRKSVAVTT